MRIDLHTHSFYSDGTESPAELVDSARAAGLDVIGLVDHDTVAGWEEAARAAQGSGIALVRGMEVTARVGETSVHILGYLFDPQHPWVIAHMAQLAQSRAERAQRIVAKLAADFPITWQRVQEIAGDASVVGRPHIADALVAVGVVPNRSAAFTSLLHAGSPYYVPHLAPQASDVVAGIAEAGGKAVWAHPWASARGDIAPIETFAELAEAGLFGVEVDHRDNPVVRRAGLADIVAREGLACLGSSDYHGTGKPNRLGENTTSREVYECLISDTRVEVVL